MTGRAWRLLVTEPADGATNMAIDEALWRGRQAGASPPTLRFFAWAPPTVSLGYGQPLDRHVDLGGVPRASASGSCGGHRRQRDLPRRPRARADVQRRRRRPRTSASAPDLLETYRWIGRALLRGLRALGAPVELVPSVAADGPTPAFCFARTGRYEIEVDGRKLVGQRPAPPGRVFLQHGSVLLGVDAPRLRALFPTTRDPARDPDHARGRARSPALVRRGRRRARRGVRGRARPRPAAGRAHARRDGDGSSALVRDSLRDRRLARGLRVSDGASTRTVPRVGVGAVVLHGGRVLLVRRGKPPLPREVEPARRPRRAGRDDGGGRAPRDRRGVRHRDPRRRRARRARPRRARCRGPRPLSLRAGGLPGLSSSRGRCARRATPPRRSGWRSDEVRDSTRPRD